MSRITARSREVLILRCLFAVTAPHRRCSAANMAWDRLVSGGRMLTILGFWLAPQIALTFILHVSFAGVKKACLDVHDTSLARRSADVLGYEVSPASAYRSGTGIRVAHVQSGARTFSSRRRTFSSRGAVRAGVAFVFREAMVNRAHGTQSIRDNSVSLPQ